MAKWLTGPAVAMACQTSWMTNTLGSRIGAITEEDDWSNGVGHAATHHRRQPRRRDRYDEHGQSDDGVVVLHIGARSR